MKSDVANYVRGCRVCQESKPEQLLPKGLMGKNPVADRPWKIISTDLIGPLPRSTQGHIFVLVVTDTFTKFSRFFPLRKATAKAVVRCIEDEIILLFGAPQVILLDNGVQYVSREFKSLTDRYGIKCRFNPVYHPQANPTERVNKTLKSMLIAFTKRDHRIWDLNLRKLACALRTSVHETTGFTPYKLVFGREFVRSGKLYGNVDDKEPICFGDRRVDTSALDECYKLVKSRLEKSQENSAHRYNLRRRAVEFHPGDLVWRRNVALSAAAQGFSSSLAPRYVGPFKIRRKVGYNTYVLEGDDREGRRKWHVKDLKGYVERQEIE